MSDLDMSLKGPRPGERKYSSCILQQQKGVQEITILLNFAEEVLTRPNLKHLSVPKLNN